MNWLRHIIFLSIALVLTFIGFHFWSNFGAAMENFNAQKAAVGRARDAERETPGEVTVGIIPSTPAQNKPACDKKHPCP
jgi:hypothetical protein